MSDILEKVEYDFICDDGPDAEFRVHRFYMVEDLNRPYDLQLDLATETIDVDTKPFLGASIELVITRGDHMRTLYGVVTAVAYVGTSADRLLVRIHAVPAFALLEQTERSRIFQNVTVQDVVKEVLEPVLKEYNRTFSPGDAPSRGTTARDYCVQYRESDFAFVSRLLEEEGISYVFVHDESKGHEVLTFKYENDQYEDAQNVDGTRLYPIVSTNPGVIDRESVQAFEWALALKPTGLRRLDYDFKTPLDPLSFEIQGTDARGRTRRPYYHMDRRFVEDDVEARANDRFEAETFGGESIVGTSNSIGFAVGLVFELERHFVADLEQDYVIHRVIHRGTCPEVLLSPSPDDDFSDDGPRYANTFHCVPTAVPLRPSPKTPKPRVHGPQTAIVTGPPGKDIKPSDDDIYTDELGRIVVQFHWEEDPKYNDTSSCWVRVAQTWAGPGWGTMFIPRIGMEVVVTFLEGNPDRPLVTGCVYNGKNKHDVPYALPGERTKSTIKSASTPGGDGFNELRFEDQAGKEEVFLHAQKDLNETILHNMSTSVGNDQSLSVGNDRTKTVKGFETIAVNKDRMTTLDGSESVTVKGSLNMVVEGGANKGKATDPGALGVGVDVTGEYNIKASQKFTVTVGASKLIMDTSNISLETSAKITLKVGGSTITLVPAQTDVVSATVQLSGGDSASVVKLDANADVKSSGQAKVHKDGGGHVLLTADAELKGANAKVNADSEAELKGGTTKVTGGPVTVKGSPVDVDGGPTVNIKGGVVNLNS